MVDKPNFSDVSDPSGSTQSLADRTRTTNEAGGVAFEADDPRVALYKVVLNNLLEDQYYDSVEESFDKIWDAYDRVVDEHPEFPLQLAAYARNEEGLRDVPQLLLVLAANDERVTQPDEDGVSLVRDYTPAIIDRTDEFRTVVSYQIDGFGKPIPNGLKQGLRDALHQRYEIVAVTDEEDYEIGTERVTFVEQEHDHFDDIDGSMDVDTTSRARDRAHARAIESIVGTDEFTGSTKTVDEGYVHDEYTFTKYQGRDADVSLQDVIGLVRPKPRSEERNVLFESLMKGELDEGQTEKEHWTVGGNFPPEEVEPLREDRTWEAEKSSDTTTVEFEDLAGVAVDSTYWEGVIELDIEANGADLREFDVTLLGRDEESEIVDVEEHSNGINTHKITVEADLSEGDEWRHRLDDMGLMARVRNLRGMLEAGLSGEEIFDYDYMSKEQMEDWTGDEHATAFPMREGAPFGPESERRVLEHQQFPIRYYQAYKACTDTGWSSIGQNSFTMESDVLDDTSEEWLNGAIDTAAQNLPDTLEDSFTVVDLSGSMDKSVSNDSELARAEIATLFGSSLAKRDADIGVFGDDFAYVDLDGARSKPTLELSEDVYSLSDRVGNSTNGYKAIEWATNNHKEYDQIVVFTDEQLWDSQRGLFGSQKGLKEVWDDYTETVSSDTQLVIVDLASYGTFSMPEGYNNVLQLSGWSDSTLEFIDKYDRIDEIINDIQSVEVEQY